MGDRREENSEESDVLMTTPPEEPSREIALPSELCRRYGLTAHTPVRLVPTRNGILIVPLTASFQCEEARQEVSAWQLRDTRATTLLPVGNALSACSAESLLSLIRLLDNPDMAVRADALGAVVARGADAVLPLLHAARQATPDFRWAIAETLGEIQDPDAVPALIQALQEPAEELRQHAARALARMEDPRTVEAFIGLLGDANPTLRIVAAESLGMLGDLRAVPGLLHALEDGLDEVRWEAADALAKIHDDRMAESYRDALQHANEPARRDIVRLLGTKSPTVGLSLLIQSLLDPGERVRCEAAAALGQQGDERAVEPLLLAAEQDTRPVRLAAIRALRHFGDGDTLCRRLIASKILFPGERLRALRFLKRAAHYEYQTTVRYLLSDVQSYCAELAEEDEDPSVRVGAREVLAALSGETLLRGSLRDEQAHAATLLRPVSGLEEEVLPGLLLRPHEEPETTPRPVFRPRESNKLTRFLRRKS